MRSLRALAQSALIVAAVVPNALQSQQFMKNLILSYPEIRIVMGIRYFANLIAILLLSAA